MSLIVRYATVADAELVADLSRQTFYDTFAAQNTKEDMELFLNHQFTKAGLMAEVGAPGNIFLLAYDNDAVAGYARLREGSMPDGSSTAALEIARLYVLQSMIGKGIGKALMQSSIEIAKAKGKQVIWLGVWEKNERAKAFYTLWGFEKFSEQPFILGQDVQRDWLMKKEI
jgi:diamine N-acetyltransferase